MFFSEKDLSPSQIDKALEKISNLYAENIEVYGSQNFDYKAFKERYLIALKTKANMANFFKLEIEALDIQIAQIKQKFEYIQKLKEVKGFGDQTIEKILSQTENYPEIDLKSPRANTEIKRLIGVCQLLNRELSNLDIYISPDSSTIFYQSYKVIQGFSQEPYSFTYKAYLEALNNDFLPVFQLDQIGQKIIKDIAISLHTFVKILSNIDPVNVGHILEYLSKVIKDFRLEIFQGLT